MSNRPEPMASPDPELWSSIEALLDGTLTAEQRDRLESLLRRDVNARQYYAAYLDLHAQLQWQTRGGSIGNLAASPVGASLKAARPRNDRRKSSRAKLSGGPVRSIIVLATAASLLIAVGVALALLLGRPGTEEAEAPDLPEPPTGSVAVLINDSRDTQWEKDMALPTATGSALPPGRLKLKAGVVEIAFLGGGAVLLEGPADFDVRTSDRAYLHRGRLTAKVPAGAAALKVDMPGVIVTDRLGECGLVRDESGRTEVHVFEGDVGTDSVDRNGDALAWARLGENTGSQVDALQQTLSPVPLNEQAFARLRPEIRSIDAAVRGGQFAGRNFGAASRLAVKNSIADYCWDSYLRFDLSGVKGSIRDARVRLMPVEVGQPVENAVGLVDDNQWGETTITWDNKPKSGPAFASWIAEAGKPVELDVTRFVQRALASDKKLSLCVFAPHRKRGNSEVQYGSREGEAEARPRLLLTPTP